MADKNPKLEFLTNVPEKFTFVKMFKQGESEKDGKRFKWWGCEVKHEGITKTLFANEYLWAKLNKVEEGDTVEITHAEIKTEKGTYKEWQITINGVEQHISKTKEIADTEEAKQEYHKEKQDKWGEIAWGKCKYGFLIEAFKKDTPLEFVEPIAEQWADASTRRLEKPLFNNTGELPSERDKEKLPF